MYVKGEAFWKTGCSEYQKGDSLGPRFKESESIHSNNTLCNVYTVHRERERERVRNYSMPVNNLPLLLGVRFPSGERERKERERREREREERGWLSSVCD